MKRLDPVHYVYIGLLIIFLAFLSYVTLEYAPEITRLASNPNEFGAFILSYGSRGVIVFILTHVLQVVVAAIPGELIQIAGGYIYGTWLGSFYSLLGIMLGSLIAFWATRLLGYPVLKIFLSPSKIEQYAFFAKSPRVELLTWILFLIPGIPKDILTYLAGLSPIQPLKFILITTVARFPGIFISAYVGSGIVTNQCLKVAVASVCAIFFFIIGLANKDRLIKRFQ